MEISRENLFAQYSTFCKTNGVKLGAAGVITAAAAILGAYLLATHNLEPTMWNKVIEPVYGIAGSCLGGGMLFLLASAVYNRKAQTSAKAQSPQITNQAVEAQVDALVKKAEDKYLLSFKSAMIGLALLVTFAVNVYFNSMSPGSIPVNLLMYGSLVGALGTIPIALASYIIGTMREAQRDRLELKSRVLADNMAMIKEVKPLEERPDFGLVNYLLPHS